MSFSTLGFETVIACTQERLERIVGKEITPELVISLPEDVDVCGENGEFHTFAYKGPIFKKSIAYRAGEKVFKQYAAPKDAGRHLLFFDPSKTRRFLVLRPAASISHLKLKIAHTLQKFGTFGAKYYFV